jgi:hypothetical protein
MKRGDWCGHQSATLEFPCGRPRTHRRSPILPTGLLLLTAAMFAPRAYGQAGFPNLGQTQLNAQLAQLCQVLQSKESQGLLSSLKKFFFAQNCAPHTSVRISKVGTVNIQNLPPPPVVSGPPTESDAFEPAPQIVEPPGKPGPAMTPSGFSDPMPAPGRSANDPTLTELTGFAAFSENGKLPPDTQIAAGRTRLLEMVNVTGAFYDKANNSQIKSFDLGSFFLTNKGQGTDPRVVYDAETATFFAAYELKTPGGDEIRLGVAAEPGDNWTIYSVDSNNVGTVFDEPKLGLSAGGVMLSWNDYINGNFMAPSTLSSKKRVLSLDLAPFLGSSGDRIRCVLG